MPCPGTTTASWPVRAELPAGETKGDSGFYEIHDYIFQNPGVQPDQVLEFAKSLGYGSDFEECYQSGDMLSEVEADFADAKAYGVDSTPTFFVNGQQLTGAQPFENFQKVIDAKLAEIQ